MKSKKVLLMLNLLVATCLGQPRPFPPNGGFPRPATKVYTPIDFDVLAQDPSGIKANENSIFWGNSFDYAVYQFTNVMWGHLNNKKQQQELENERIKAVSKLSIIRSQYQSYDKYPEKIIDGWHSVICTDNSNFCKEAKVLVQNNRIKRVVLDNYLPVNFNATGEIKKAKNVITIQNFNREQLNIVELYFLYDIEDQVIVSEPQKPAIVCFWAEVNRYDAILLDIDGERAERFTKVIHSPECMQQGMVIRILKPGIHNLYAQGRGAITWKDDFEAKSGQCLSYRIGR